MKEEEKYYWVAVNRSSATACLSTPLTVPRVTPTPESLIGFPTGQEATTAQRFLLNAPIRDIPAQLRKWQERDDMKIIIPKSPKPPSTVTMWMDDGSETAASRLVVRSDSEL